MQKIVLILLVVLTSSSAYSQGLPEWTEYEGKACYDLPSAKKLKKYALRCDACEEQLRIRVAQYLGCEAAADRLTTSTLSYQKSVTHLSEALRKTQVLLEDTDKLLDQTEAWSLKGGALPWAVAGSAVILVAGFFLGVAI